MLVHARSTPSGTTVETDVCIIGGGGSRNQLRARIREGGGIENARLLLLSNRTHPAGVGSQNDLVGRFFMDHIGINSGRLDG
jgi:hypothetical protein